MAITVRQFDDCWVVEIEKELWYVKEQDLNKLVEKAIELKKAHSIQKIRKLVKNKVANKEEEGYWKTKKS